MTAEIGLVVDSTADFPSGMTETLGLHIVPIHIMIDGQDHRHGVDIQNQQILAAMRAGRDVSTAPPIPSEYTDIFETLLARYDRLISFHVSRQLSKCFVSAQSAIQLFFEETATRLKAVDTRTCTVGQALLVRRALEMLQEGLGAEELVREFDFYINNSTLYFTVDNLYWLKRAGRLNFFSSALGGMLDIKPVIGLKNGKLYPLSKHRGFDAALEAIAAFAREDYRLHRGECDIWLAHAEARDKVDFLLKKLEEWIPAAVDRIRVAEIGPTISAHAGPGCICLSVVPR
jgi:DegV family protein with EDD domain